MRKLIHFNLGFWIITNLDLSWEFSRSRELFMLYRGWLCYSAQSYGLLQSTRFAVFLHFSIIRCAVYICTKWAWTSNSILPVHRFWHRDTHHPPCAAGTTTTPWSTSSRESPWWRARWEGQRGRGGTSCGWRPPTPRSAPWPSAPPWGTTPATTPAPRPTPLATPCASTWPMVSTPTAHSFVFNIWDIIWWKPPERGVTTDMMIVVTLHMTPPAATVTLHSSDSDELSPPSSSSSSPSHFSHTSGCNTIHFIEFSDKLLLFNSSLIQYFQIRVLHYSKQRAGAQPSPSWPPHPASPSPRPASLWWPWPLGICRQPLSWLIFYHKVLLLVSLSCFSVSELVLFSWSKHLGFCHRFKYILILCCRCEIQLINHFIYIIQTFTLQSSKPQLVLLR